MANVRISKGLSWLLRHEAENQGVSIDRAGYCLVDDVLGCKRLRGASLADLQSITAASDKQRFHMKQVDGQWYIRANQGHSIASVQAEELLTKLEPTFAEAHPYAYHGTYRRSWDSILASGGLSKMGRNHMHFATNVPELGEVKSGMRASCDLIVKIDLRNPAVWEAIDWYRAANDVVLTAGIGGILPLILVAEVVERATGRIVYVSEHNEPA